MSEAKSPLEPVGPNKSSFRGPITQHILVATGNEPFCLADLQESFAGQYDYWQLYNAIRDLKNTGKITLAYKQTRRNYYVKNAEGQMPRIKDANNKSIAISAFLDPNVSYANADKVTTPQTSAGQKVSKFPVVIMRLFRLAIKAETMSDENFAVEFQELMAEFRQIRVAADGIVKWHDSIISHGAMQYNRKEFIKGFTKDPAWPSPDLINDANIWATENWK